MGFYETLSGLTIPTPTFQNFVGQENARLDIQATFLDQLVKVNEFGSLGGTLAWDCLFHNYLVPASDLLAQEEARLDLSTRSARFDSTKQNCTCDGAKEKVQLDYAIVTPQEMKQDCTVFYREHTCSGSGILNELQEEGLLLECGIDEETITDAEVLGYTFWDIMDFYGREWIRFAQWKHFKAALSQHKCLRQSLKENYQTRQKFVTRIKNFWNQEWTQSLRGCASLFLSTKFLTSYVPLLSFSVLDNNVKFSSPAVRTNYTFSPYTGMTIKSPITREINREPLELSNLLLFGGVREGCVVIRFNPNDTSVGIEQCGVRFQQGKYEIFDLGSKNGTYYRLQGKSILRKGDMFLIGDNNLFDVGTATICKQRVRHPEFQKKLAERNFGMPMVEQAEEGEDYGFQNQQNPPQMALRAYGGEHAGKQMKNFQMVDGTPQRHMDHLIFGRRGCHYQFNDEHISRSHFQIRWLNNIGFVLDDMKSGTGTWWGLNTTQNFICRSPSHFYRLRPEDTIRMGRYQFKVSFTE
eukprot:CAMPEP_0114991404 /NCGR_PEP_ID=MMETSP0216-20121206/11350_1 /TAXON_ID=223996 /ORGANISM="Protocruzia adherens, Strain Boccale" /LENGTH=523 /DNA_ID=CAMNT_0002354721 /DNA_START=87 /DNA_END=1659 /DNA_ORIENTATION=-